MPGVAVQLEHLGKTFPGGHVALGDLTLDVLPGEWLVIVGPSGSGKTTLLRLIAGLDQPTTGTIKLDGRPATHLPPWRRGIAMAFQRPALSATRTVRGNLLLGRTALDPARIQHLARMLGLEDVLDHYPYQLSGGQQQRAALGRALARQAPLCLFDEPLGHLDAPLRERLRRDLLLLHQELGATMISVTHDPAEAWGMGQRVAILHQGTLQQVDAPQRLYRSPQSRFVAEFFARGPLNLFPGVARRQGNSIQWLANGWRCDLPWPVSTDGATVEGVLGLRAEDIQVEMQPAAGPDCRALRVTQVEPQPGGAWVRGEVDAFALVGWATRVDGLSAGQMAWATMNWNQAILFDGITGRTVRAAAG